MGCWGSSPSKEIHIKFLYLKFRGGQYVLKILQLQKVQNIINFYWHKKPKVDGNAILDDFLKKKKQFKYLISLDCKFEYL